MINDAKVRKGAGRILYYSLMVMYYSETGNFWERKRCWWSVVEKLRFHGNFRWLWWVSTMKLQFLSSAKGGFCFVSCGWQISSHQALY